jgi:5'-nucleotidase
MFVVLYLLTALVFPVTASGQEEGPMRILLTNDDGIEKVEERVYPLAQQLRRFAEVYIVVSNQDRSGTTHIMSLNRKMTLESRLEHISEAGNGLHRLEIHVVDGYPADCVAVGVGGIMVEDPPDLVISGPNGGGGRVYGSSGACRFRAR